MSPEVLSLAIQLAVVTIATTLRIDMGALGLGVRVRVRVRRGRHDCCQVMSTAIFNCPGRGAIAALKADCTSATGWTWLT